MTGLNSFVLGLLTALAIGLPATAAEAAVASAAPAGKSWTTIQRLAGARQQACKVSADGGASWKIYNRLDARTADVRIKATLTVTRNGVATSRTWRSGWVRPGRRSDVGTVKIPRRPGFGIMHTISADQMGNGGVMTASAIGRC